MDLLLLSFFVSYIVIINYRQFVLIGKIDDIFPPTLLMVQLLLLYLVLYTLTGIALTLFSISKTNLPYIIYFNKYSFKESLM
jgi:hypothetical protein